MYGQIAASNALSDVYAMGGIPITALNLLCITEEIPKSVVAEIIRGGSDKVAESGASITGGHTIKSKEPIYGLSVMGIVSPDKVLTNANAQDGDLLILTKKLGIGLITTAAKAEIADKTVLDEASQSMAKLNKNARDIMVKFSPSSCTDITGFGLAGHSMEMAKGSNTTIELYSDKLPYFSQALEYANMGLIPEGSYRNRDYTKNDIQIETSSLACKNFAIQDILYDPQTSGGLLFSLKESEANRCIQEMNNCGEFAVIVGRVTKKQNKSLIIK